MSVASVFATLFKSIPSLAILALNLVWIYFTLGRRVQKTRQAFEKQLMEQGMSEQDARRLSVCFEDLKGSITGIFREGIVDNLRFQTD